MPDERTTPPGPPDEEPEVDYANNTFIVPTVWDLKILFGELSPRSQFVDWHTAITLPWAHAKLLTYYLRLNVASYESQNGPIRIPDAAIPAEVPPLPKDSENDRRWQRFRKIAQEIREELIKSLPPPPEQSEGNS